MTLVFLGCGLDFAIVEVGDWFIKLGCGVDSLIVTGGSDCGSGMSLAIDNFPYRIIFYPDQSRQEEPNSRKEPFKSSKIPKSG